MKKLLVLLAFVAGSFADGGSANRGPPPVKESFFYNSREYHLYSEKVGWEEASAICQSNEGHLAVADDSGKATFLAQSIGEAWAPLEDMWIGGQLKEDVWKWVEGSAKRIPETSRQVGNFSFLYPPWIEGAMPNRKGKECLALDRNGHSDPFFIDLECNMPRPFICEQNKKKTDGSPQLAKTLKILDREFVLYNARVTWEQAVAFCRSTGHVLAAIPNNTYAEMLAKAMLKTRPEFEGVWIGGSYKRNKWLWVENSEEISVNPVPDLKGIKYPPWNHIPPETGPNCIIFDRHLCEMPKFLDIKCNRLRDFVCSKLITPDPNSKTAPRVVVSRNKGYVVHHAPANYDEAKKICEEETKEKGPGKLLYIDGGQTNDPNEELALVMQIMSGSQEELIHVWLAAKYDGKAFKWEYNSSNFNASDGNVNRRVLLSHSDENTGFPPWCNNDEPSADMACLNLDRQNYNTPLFYGLECNATQPFICTYDISPKGIERFTVGGKGYQTSDHNLTKEEPISVLTAEAACDSDTGSNIDMMTEKELEELCKKLNDGTYLFGTRYIPPHYKLGWVSQSVEAKLGSVEIEPYVEGKLCTTLTVDKGKPKKINAIKCDERNTLPYICVDKCGSLVDEVSDNTWKCDWREGTHVTQNMVDKTCEKRCPEDQILVGSKKITCTKESGWIGSKSSNPPKCVASSEAPDTIKKIIKDDKTPSKVLFIYDGTTNEMSADKLEILKYIIGSTVTNIEKTDAARKRRFIGGRQLKHRGRRDSARIRVPVISLSSQASNPMVLEGKDICEVISKVGSNNFSSGGRRDYNKAFMQTVKQLQDLKPVPYSVVVISEGPNQGDIFKESLRQLKLLAQSVLTIGIGNKAISEELEDIATTDQEGSTRTMAVSDYVIMHDIANALALPATCDSDLEKLKVNSQAALERIRQATISARQQKGGPEIYNTEQDYDDQPDDTEEGVGVNKKTEKPSSGESDQSSKAVTSSGVSTESSKAQTSSGVSKESSKAGTSSDVSTESNKAGTSSGVSTESSKAATNSAVTKKWGKVETSSDASVKLSKATTSSVVNKKTGKVDSGTDSSKVKRSSAGSVGSSEAEKSFEGVEDDDY